MRTIQQRLERLEKMVGNRGLSEPDCICFPVQEQPRWDSLEEQQAADRLKCPLHGDRFFLRGFIYTSAWLLEKREVFLKYRGRQYLKAFYAHFTTRVAADQGHCTR